MLSSNGTFGVHTRSFIFWTQWKQSCHFIEDRPVTFNCENIHLFFVTHTIQIKRHFPAKLTGQNAPRGTVRGTRACPSVVQKENWPREPDGLLLVLTVITRSWLSPCCRLSTITHSHPMSPCPHSSLVTPRCMNHRNNGAQHSRFLT